MKTSVKPFVPKRERIVGKFKSELEDKLEKLEDIKHINHGGCGVAALAIYRYLVNNGIYQKYLSFTFTYVGWDRSLYEKNLDNHNNGLIENLEVPSHIVVTFKGSIHIDSEGWNRYIGETKYVYTHEATLEEVENLVNSHGWNHLFDREEIVPIVEKIFDINLSDIDLTISV